MFLLPLYFSIYTLNKSFSLKGEKPKMRGKLESKIGEGNFSWKLGKKLCPILIPNLGR